MNESKNNDKNTNINEEKNHQNTTSNDVNDEFNSEAHSNDKENDQNNNTSDEVGDNKDVTQDDLTDLKDQLLRALAENENLRKRTAKEIEQIKKYGHISLLRDLLNVVDNLERAVKSTISNNSTDTTITNLINGIEIVLKDINSLLEKNQIKKIEPLNEKFDYNFHQAMFEAPSSDYDEGVILEVIQPGYILHDRLIRPAMVGVSKGLPQEKDKNEEKNE